MKEKYVAKYGYTINIPGVSDIIKISGIREPTKRENRLYRNGNIAELGEGRYYALKRLKAQKKASFLRMLSSPTPEVVQNIGTIMTFFDDLNDSLGTLGVVGRTILHFLPRAMQTLLTGPLSALFWTADIINIVQQLSLTPLQMKMVKKNIERLSHENPLSKKSKANVAKRMMKLAPSKGEVIEALQVSNSVFGVGISLGPILGAIEESIFGPMRVLQGHKVKTNWPKLWTSQLEEHAFKTLSEAPTLMMMNPILSDLEYFKCLVMVDRSIQVLHPLFEENNPLDLIDSIDDVYMQAPTPTNPMTLDVFEEMHVYPDEFKGFPFAHGSFSSLAEMPDIYEVRLYNRMLAFFYRNRNSYLGYLGSQLVTQIAENSIALIEGDDQVRTDIDPVWKLCNTILANNHTFPHNMSESKQECIKFFCQTHYQDFDSWPFRYINKYLSDFCGIDLVPEF
jgi:hypothetical protein